MYYEPTTNPNMGPAPEPRTRTGGLFSLNHLVLQLGLTCLVFYLWSSPVVQPIKLMVVLFHEISHGMMALFSGGKIISILITADEGGACETEGGSETMIVTAGYLGSMLVGGMILYLSRAKHFVPLVFGLLTLILVAAITTVIRDSYSRTFASGLAVAFVLCGFLAPSTVGSLLLRAIGTFTCLYSIFDIYWDILASQGAAAGLNDAVAFSQLTGAEPQVVGVAWLAICLVFFLLVLKSVLQEDDEVPAVEEPPSEHEGFNLPAA